MLDSYSRDERNSVTGPTIKSNMLGKFSMCNPVSTMMMADKTADTIALTVQQAAVDTANRVSGIPRRSSPRGQPFHPNELVTAGVMR